MKTDLPRDVQYRRVAAAVVMALLGVEFCRNQWQAWQQGATPDVAAFAFYGGTAVALGLGLRWARLIALYFVLMLLGHWFIVSLVREALFDGRRPEPLLGLLAVLALLCGTRMRAAFELRPAGPGRLGKLGVVLHGARWLVLWQAIALELLYASDEVPRVAMAPLAILAAATLLVASLGRREARGIAAGLVGLEVAVTTWAFIVSVSREFWFWRPSVPLLIGSAYVPLLATAWLLRRWHPELDAEARAAPSESGVAVPAVKPGAPPRPQGTHQ